MHTTGLGTSSSTICCTRSAGKGYSTARTMSSRTARLPTTFRWAIPAPSCGRAGCITRSRRPSGFGKPRGTQAWSAASTSVRRTFTGRAMLDLNRLAPEVTALNTAKPRVALLYSQPSIFWETQYPGTLRSLYTVLNFMGENVTFVSERQLAEGKAAKVQWLLVPDATHVLPSTPGAVAAFAKADRKRTR